MNTESIHSVISYQYSSSIAMLAVSTAVTMADEEEEVDEDAMCPSGKHKWLNDKCMVCTTCGECTGYGSSCITTGRPQRNPGL
jgi:E3 ubiquitin-protein ligase MYCBP2